MILFTIASIIKLEGDIFRQEKNAIIAISLIFIAMIEADGNEIK